MYFLIFQPEDMLMMLLNLNESQAIYAYTCWACKNVCNFEPLLNLKLHNWIFMVTQNYDPSEKKQ